MNLLHRLWLLLTGRSVPNPREQALRTHANRVAAVAHGRAERIRRGDEVRADYRRGDKRIGW